MQFVRFCVMLRCFIFSIMQMLLCCVVELDLLLRSAIQAHPHEPRYRGHRSLHPPETLAVCTSTKCAQAYQSPPFTQGRASVFITATNHNVKNPIVQCYLAPNIFISLSWPVFFLPEPITLKINMWTKCACSWMVRE